MAELTRDQRNLEEEVEDDSSLTETPDTVNGEAEQVHFIDRSVTDEEEECRTNRPTPPSTAPPQVQWSSVSVSHPSPSSPTLEERRRPGTLLIWQERERIHQRRDHTARDNSLLKTTTAKTGSHVATLSQTGSSSSGGSPENSQSQNGLRQRCASADQMSLSHVAPVQRSVSRSDGPSSPKASSPPGLSQKPNSFLFRTSSRCSVNSQVSISGSTHSLVEAGRSVLRREERPDVAQLRKTLESRLKTTLPEDLGEALSNGTVLCQLANHMRPRAVSIIHIPSPAVTEVCVFSDVFLCKLPAVLRCVEALVKCEVEGETPHNPCPSLLSEGFLVFYILVMVLLYTLYRHLVT
ncbi:unnamed protein product [Coregonus sp. 'balchen']|nr:unnamed protein product [Coregonus sp. 'balchen']